MKEMGAPNKRGSILNTREKKLATYSVTTVLVIAVIVLTVVGGVVSYQYATNAKGSSQSTTLATTTITIMTVSSITTETETTFITGSQSSTTGPVVLNGVYFSVDGYTYTLTNKSLSFQQDSTITFAIVLYNYVLDSSNASMKNPPPLARAVNGTDIATSTPQYYNYHVLGYSQIFNESPPATSIWFNGYYLPGSDEGAIPNYGNDTLYVEILLPKLAYTGTLTIRVF